MDTDKHGSVPLSRKSFATCQGFSFACSWERTHPACRVLDTLGTLEACAPRDGTSAFSASLCGEIRFGCGWAALCSSVFICGLSYLNWKPAESFVFPHIISKAPPSAAGFNSIVKASTRLG